MKHAPPVTVLLIGLFILSQLVGLALVAHVTPTEFIPPTTGEAAQSGGTLLLGVLIGTILLLVIIRLKWAKVWKTWFLLAVWAAMTFSLAVFLQDLTAIVVAGVLAAWKIFRPNVLVHNLTEVLVYSGITLLIIDALNMNLLIAALLLVVVALYDAYAVWKSKHMVKMAQFQSESKLFAGLLVPYGKEGKPDLTKQVKPAKNAKTVTQKTAVLGGGDITFPLLFSAAVLQHLVSTGISVWQAFFLTLPVTAGATIALSGLLLLARKDAFYPAMPFIGAGCFVGFAATWLIKLAIGG